MVRLSEKAIQDRMRAYGLTWTDVERLWTEVLDRSVPGWDAGKALEHLVIRGIALSGLRVEYPRQSVDIGVIAKLRTQLQRRPPSTMGCVFSSGSFTGPAVVLANVAVPHRITLWSRDDITEGVALRDFAGLLRRKYHELCMFGLMDQSNEFPDLKAAADED
jgi:hypothetical protein